MVYFQSTSSACARCYGPLPHSAFNSLHHQTKVAEERIGEGEGKVGGRKPPAFKCTNKEAAAEEGRQGGPEAGGTQGPALHPGVLPARPPLPRAHLCLRLDQGWEKCLCLHALLPSIGRNRLALTPIPPQSRMSGRAWDFQPQLLWAGRCPLDVGSSTCRVLGHILSTHVALLVAL